MKYTTLWPPLAANAQQILALLRQSDPEPLEIENDMQFFTITADFVDIDLSNPSLGHLDEVVNGIVIECRHADSTDLIVATCLPDGDVIEFKDEHGDLDPHVWVLEREQ